MAALSQLSYSPVELVFICKGNTRALVVAGGRGKPQFAGTGTSEIGSSSPMSERIIGARLTPAG